MIRTKTQLLALLAIACGTPALSAQQQPGIEDTALTGPAPALLPEPAIPTEATLFRLRSGGILWGAIDEHAAEQVTVRRLDTGGLVRLPWNLLDSTQELDLRRRFGYVDTAAEEIMIPGQKLVLHDGNELVGLLLAPIGDDLVIKEASGPRRVKRSLVDHIARVEVAALDVYSKDELYLDESAKIDETSAQAHYELAEYCERIFDFAHALEHYDKAAELDPTFMADELPNIVARMEVKAQQQEQLELLGEIDRLGRRRLYQKALEMLAEFDATYPDSPLRANRLKIQSKIEDAREKYVRDSVVRLKWYSWMDRLAAKAARLPSYEGALAFVDETMSEEIARNVTEDARRYWPEVEADQVRQLWLERKPGRWRHASYGHATWLLGEDDAKKGGPEAIVKDAEEGNSRDAARDDLEKKIERFIKNQQIAKRAKRSEQEANELESYWLGMSHASRRAWLLAYYVENSGELEVNPKPHLQNCPTCAGQGFREIMYTGSGSGNQGSGGIRREMCETCQGVAVIRRVHFR